jgi:hypothetical protein
MNKPSQQKIILPGGAGQIYHWLDMSYHYPEDLGISECISFSRRMARKEVK